MDKRIITLFALVGSIAGGYIPLLWGGSAFSMSSVLLSGMGGLIGVIIGFNIARD